MKWVATYNSLRIMFCKNEVLNISYLTTTVQWKFMVCFLQYLIFVSPISEDTPVSLVTGLFLTETHLLSFLYFDWLTHCLSCLLLYMHHETQDYYLDILLNSRNELFLTSLRNIRVSKQKRRQHSFPAAVSALLWLVTLSVFSPAWEGGGKLRGRVGKLD